jgi:hypothetical protein
MNSFGKLFFGAALVLVSQAAGYAQVEKVAARVQGQL